jgi:hypothetical protein
VEGHQAADLIAQVVLVAEGVLQTFLRLRGALEKTLLARLSLGKAQLQIRGVGLGGAERRGERLGPGFTRSVLQGFLRTAILSGGVRTLGRAPQRFQPIAA